jgi:hypothetical protein
MLKTYDIISHILYVCKSYKHSVLIKSYSKIELRLSPPLSLTGLELYVLLQTLVLLSVFLAANTHRLLLFAMCFSFNLIIISALKLLTFNLLFIITCPLFYLLYLSPIKRLKQLITNRLKLCLN